jgi:hypothetical protein
MWKRGQGGKEILYLLEEKRVCKLKKLFTVPMAITGVRQRKPSGRP